MPGSFLWGVSQVSSPLVGTVHSDVYDWQRSQGRAALASPLDSRLFAADVGFSHKLGYNAYHVELDWSSLQPTVHGWDEDMVQQYRDMLQSLRAHNMRSIVSLHRSAQPLWLAREGGFTNVDAIGHYLQYLERVINSLGDLIQVWLTFWQPTSVTRKTLQHMERVHSSAYRLVHRSFPRAQVGVVQNMMGRDEASHPFGRDEASHPFGHDEASDVCFWHYTLSAHKIGGYKHGGVSHRDSILADALYRLTPKDKPLYVIADFNDLAQDEERAGLIRSHLRTIEDAQKRGVQVHGYLVTPAEGMLTSSQQVLQAIIQAATI